MDNIRSYIIDISNSTLDDRLKLRAILESLNEKIFIMTSVFTEETRSTSFGFRGMDNNHWAGGGRKPNISLSDFLYKFQIKVRKPKQQKQRNK